MKTSSVAQTAFLLALTAGTGNATRYLTTVKNFGVKFKMYWWDDGRDEPYRMSFTKRGIYSAYAFNALGELQSITVEGEEQTFSTSRKLRATPEKTGSRKLLAMDEDLEADEMEFEQDYHRRRLYECSDCENTWDTLCDTGLADVCAVVAWGGLTGDAKTALKIFCTKFTKECDAASGEETCADDCTEDIPEECDPNPCENGGECSADPAGGHVCSCPSGYGGMSCQTETSSGRLLISAALEEIDGVGGTLGSAGPTSVWTACKTISLLGAMRFDIDDIENMEDAGTFEGVIQHEMGHVIGIGTLWGTGFGECTTCYDDLDPAWTCPAAVSAYYDIGGSDADIIEIDGGTGTSCGHLDEGIFDDELMTGYVDNVMYLSKMTAAILDDLDYIVDGSAVDSYSHPSDRVDSINAEDAPSVSINDTAVITTIFFVDEDGSVEETEGLMMVF
eukprot:jgi/Undpi1/8898/HiC_scaffold_25.g11360.m1